MTLPVWLTALIGPWLLKAAPFAARIPAWASVKVWLKIATYVAALGAGAWFGAKAVVWWQGPKITLAESDTRAKEKCDATIASATFEARTKALDARETALMTREQSYETDSAALAAFATDLEAYRAATLKSPATPFVHADDPWLRAWQKRGG